MFCSLVRCSRVSGGRRNFDYLSNVGSGLGLVELYLGHSFRFTPPPEMVYLAKESSAWSQITKRNQSKRFKMLIKGTEYSTNSDFVEFE